MKNFFFACIAIFIGLALVCALIGVAELTVRMFVPVRPSVDMSHPILNHCWRPDFTWTDTAGNVCHYNAQSWIETYDIRETKAPNTYRIFYVGDSNTEGPLPVATSLPSRVETQLNAIPRLDETVFEVVNTGTSSYAPSIYYLLIKNYILPFNPDLVVINVDMTDVFDDFLYRDTAQYDAAGELIACPPGHRLKGRFVRTKEGIVQLSFEGRVYNFMKEHFLLFSVLRPMALTLLQKTGQDPQMNGGVATTSGTPYPGLLDWCKEPWSPTTQELVAQSMDRLRKTIRMLKEKNIAVALTGFPHRPHFEYNGETPVFSTKCLDAIKQVCADEGVVYIDMYNGLLARVPRQDIPGLYVEDAIHFTPAGYEKLATIHVSTFMQNRATIFKNVRWAETPNFEM